MRKPPPAPAKPTAPTAPPVPQEPADGRALQRARQFALQRGLPDPAPAVKSPTPAAAGKRPARKKKP
jgi:hypothetical protein